MAHLGSICARAWLACVYFRRVKHLAVIVIRVKYEVHLYLPEFI